MLLRVSAEKSATLNVFGIPIAKGIEGVTMDLPSYDTGTNLLINRMKYIVDTITKIDKFRRSCVKILKNARKYFEAEFITFENKFVFTVRRSFDMTTIDFPIKVNVRVNGAAPDPDKVYTDGTGSPVNYFVFQDFLAFLYERFGRILSHNVIDKTIADCEKSATAGFMGLFDSKILGLADLRCTWLPMPMKYWQ